MENNADINTQNHKGQTPLDNTSEDWSKVRFAIGLVAGFFKVDVDMEATKAWRMETIKILRERGGKPGSEFKLPADLIIKSLGFDPENLPKLFNANELGISKWGTIKIDLTSMQTNIPGVFAAGDIVRGASLVVWAIRDGRDAAVQIEKYLKSIELRKGVAA